MRGWRSRSSSSAATAPPPLDLAAVEGVTALLRYAGSQRDADARRALLAPQSGVRPDDARTLLASAGERDDLLETIAKGAVADANRFAHGLATVTAAYKTPDASATSVLATIFSAFPLDDTAGARSRSNASRATSTRPARSRSRGRRATSSRRSRPSSAARRAARARVGDVAPAPPVDDEPPVPVAIRKLSFSASSLNTYAECARKWWFRYACAAVEDRGSSASFYGIAFHAALEDFHATHTRFDERDARAARRRAGLLPSSPRSTGTARASTRRSSSSCRNVARGAPPRSISRGCSSARAARRSR